MATAGRHAPFTFADLHGHLLMSHESRIQGQVSHTNGSLPSPNNPSAFAVGSKPNYQNRSNTQYQTQPNNQYQNKPANSYQNRPNNQYNPRPTNAPSFQSNLPRSTYQTAPAQPHFNQQQRPRTPFNNAKPNYQNNSKPQCQICSKFGHVAKECYLRYKTDPSYQGRPPSNFQSYVANPSSSTNTSAEWSMCSDDSKILFLKFENRCPCKGCPDQIRRAIVTFDGVRETRSVDYNKGTAELIVNAEIAKNPQKLCNWILKETRKHAYVDNTYNTSYLHEDSHGHGERKEKIVFREHRVREVRITK